MKIRKLISYSESTMKGTKRRLLLAGLLPVTAELLFRLAEAAAYSLLLYFRDISPLGLFTGESSVQLIAAVVCTVWRWLTCAPLIYAAAYRFCGLYCGGCKRSLSELILDRSVCRRSLAALLWSKLLGFLFVIPVFFFGAAAYWLAVNGEGSIHVLLTVHAAVMAVISAAVWLRTKLVTVVVPFVMAYFPEMSAFRAVTASFRLMSGRRGVLLRLFALYVLPMITIIAVPFLLPGFFSAVALLVDISVKEDEYSERNKADGRIGKTDDASEFPARKKRRFTKAADKAEAAG